MMESNKAVREMTNDMGMTEPVNKQFTEEQLSDIQQTIDEINSKIDLIDYTDIDKLSLSEIENILGERFVKDIEATVSQNGNDFNAEDFKRDFLRYLKGDRDRELEIEKFNANIIEAHNEFSQEMKKLVEDLGNDLALANIDKKLAEETDPIKKASLLAAKESIVNVISFKSIEQSILNKSVGQIRKETKKEFDSTYKKAIRCMKNDKQLYMSPTEIVKNLILIAGKENEFEAKCIAYSVFRMILKAKNSKQKSFSANMFINHFIVILSKTVKDSEKNEDFIKDENFKNNLGIVINLLKNEVK